MQRLAWENYNIHSGCSSCIVCASIFFSLLLIARYLAKYYDHQHQVMESPANPPSAAPVPAPAPAPATATSPPSPFPNDPYPRLSLNPPARIALGSAVSAVVGFSLGATQGGQTAQLRFRAEHAHKMPDSTAGWYLYHKSKNYHVMFGGLREGFRMASRTGAWTLMALSLESTVDRCRGTSDLFSTIIASLSVAGAFSLWSKCKTLCDRGSVIHPVVIARTSVQYHHVSGWCHFVIIHLAHASSYRDIGDTHGSSYNQLPWCYVEIVIG